MSSQKVLFSVCQMYEVSLSAELLWIVVTHSHTVKRITGVFWLLGFSVMPTEAETDGIMFLLVLLIPNLSQQ